MNKHKKITANTGEIEVARPLQLAILVVQNRRTGEQKSHWAKTNQKAYIILKGNFVCLSCPSATFALQYGGFVPRDRLAVKGPESLFFSVLLNDIGIMIHDTCQ